MSDNDIYISGLAFHKISTWSFCPRYPVKFDIDEIKSEDLVFLNLDMFTRFMNILEKNPPPYKFNLITHNSDECFTDAHHKRLQPYVNKIFAINSTCYNQNVTTIPIGFRDMPVYTIPIIKGTFKQKKEILIYMNFTIRTNYTKRTECFNSFVKKPWVTSRSNLPIGEFYNDMAKSKFVLSPEGTGIDCHRIYESIYFDAVPLLKTSRMDNFYKNLPVLIVDKWEDITEHFLNTNYEGLFNKLVEWKRNNPNWLDPKAWL